MDKTAPIINFLLEVDDDDDLIKDVMGEPPPPDQFDIWERTYRPVKNEIEPSDVFNGIMFETYGAEFEFVRAAKPNHVWTYVTGDNCEDIIVAGLHYVNREGYFITELPWKDGTESFQFGDGDPTDAEGAADEFINYELGQEWKMEWAAMPPEERVARVHDYAETVGLEDQTPAIIALIDKQARSA